MRKKIKKLIEGLRKQPCYMCGHRDKRGCHIVGYDTTDVDKLLFRYYTIGTVLCNDCLFK